MAVVCFLYFGKQRGRLFASAASLRPPFVGRLQAGRGNDACRCRSLVHADFERTLTMTRNSLAALGLTSLIALSLAAGAHAQTVTSVASESVEPGGPYT